MKAKRIGLQTSVTGTYDKTKTTIAGNVAQKTINTKQVVGPPLTVFGDVFSDSGQTNSGPISYTPNNRLFVMTIVSAGAVSIMCYSFNKSTGAKTFMGRLILTLPNAAATAHTVRSLRVYDGASEATVTGWKIFITTVGNVVLNGGIFMANNIALADFSTISPPQIFFGISSNAKAMYMLQDPAGLGVANNITTAIGSGLNTAANEILVASGTAATFNIQGFDYSISPTVNIQTTTSATSVASPTFTLTGHGYTNNDMVAIIANNPTPFTLTTAIAQTVYFIRNSAANTFELSATSGGASINATSVTSSTQFVRAFGQTSALHIAGRKTGSITSSFVGTALLTDGVHIKTMNDSTSPNYLQNVMILPTSTNFYNFRLTDLTAGVTSLPSAQGINATGTGSDITATTPTFMQYSELANHIVFAATTFSFHLKKWVNSLLVAQFGGQVNTYMEGSTALTQFFGMTGVLGMEVSQGWLFVNNNVVGQRGFLAMDLRSDTRFDYSYAISPVTNLGAYPSVFKFLSTIEQLYEITDTTTLSYRTATTSGDSIFNTAAGGWTVIASAADLSAIALSQYVQIKIQYDICTLLSSTPSQITDLDIGYIPLTEISDNWEGSVDNSSRSSESPTYIAFRLILAYAASVPTLYVRGLDDSGSLVHSFNTSANAVNFNYSSNNGTSWNALGTIPNTILTTELRLQLPSPTGNRITWSIGEA